MAKGFVSSNHAFILINGLINIPTNLSFTTPTIFGKRSSGNRPKVKEFNNPEIHSRLIPLVKFLISFQAKPNNSAIFSLIAPPNSNIFFGEIKPNKNPDMIELIPAFTFDHISVLPVISSTFLNPFMKSKAAKSGIRIFPKNPLTTNLNNFPTLFPRPLPPIFAKIPLPSPVRPSFPKIFLKIPPTKPFIFLNFPKTFLPRPAIPSAPNIFAKAEPNIVSKSVFFFSFSVTPNSLPSIFSNKSTVFSFNAISLFFCPSNKKLFFFSAFISNNWFCKLLTIKLKFVPIFFNIGDFVITEKFLENSFGFRKLITFPEIDFIGSTILLETSSTIFEFLSFKYSLIDFVSLFSILLLFLFSGL